MDDLRNQYSAIRSEYQQTLVLASKEQGSDKRKDHFLRLIELNNQMNERVSAMMRQTAQTESRVDLSELNSHLSDELVRIQRDSQALHGSADSNEVLRQLANKPPPSTDGSVYLYLIVLAIGLFMIVLAILQSSFATPAMPPLSTPQLGWPGSTQL